MSQEAILAPAEHQKRLCHRETIQCRELARKPLGHAAESQSSENARAKQTACISPRCLDSKASMCFLGNIRFNPQRAFMLIDRCIGQG